MRYADAAKVSLQACMGGGEMRSIRSNLFIKTIGLFLRCSGLHHRGRRNLFDLEVRHESWNFSGIPEVLDGARILHLSDLHIDLCPEVVDGVIEKIKTLDYDLVVMTGDYQDGSGEEALTQSKFGLSKLREAIQGEAYLILGNHDDPSLLDWAEGEGYVGLHNQSIWIDQGGFFLGGIGFHREGDKRTLENLREVARGWVPGAGFSLLLSHSPHTAAMAAKMGFDLFLSGHTHGGQICLPGGRHLWAACKIPRRLCAGRWKVGEMGGYTSRGVGGSGLAVRFNCPPEITVHSLWRTNPG